MIRPTLLAGALLLASLSSPAEARGGSRYGCPERAWCGCWLAKHLGKHNRNLYRAFAWLSEGRPAPGPQVGAIVVFRHSHVGIVREVAAGKIRVLSGNDGSAVRERWRSTAGVRGYRVL